MSELEQRLCAVISDCFQTLAAVSDAVHAHGDMELYQELNDTALRAQEAVRAVGGVVPVARSVAR